MRTSLLIAFVLVAVVPIVLLALALSAQDTRRNEASARARLREVGLSIQQEVDQYLESHRSAVVALASQMEATARDTSAQNAALRRYHHEYPGFYTMIATDATGRIVAADSQPTRTDVAVLQQRLSVADRAYFRTARDTGRPYISDAFLGRGFGVDPIVAISAAMHDDKGMFTGVVEGSLDLRRFRRFEIQYQSVEAVEIVILDGKSRVVYASSRTGFKPLEDRTGSPMLLAAASAQDPASFYFERPVDGKSVEYMVTQQPLQVTAWRVFVRQPVSVLRSAHREHYLLTAVWTLAAIVLCFLLAHFAAQRVTRPLGALARSVHDFQLTGAAHPLDIERHAPAEVRELVQGFEEMQTRLSHSLQGLLPICASCKRVRDEHGQWNQIESYIRARSEAEFSHGICPECARRLYPEDYKR